MILVYSMCGFVASRCGSFFIFCLVYCRFVVFGGYVWQNDYLVGEEVGEEWAGCFAFLWFVACVRSVGVCLFFLLMSSVGRVL